MLAYSFSSHLCFLWSRVKSSQHRFKELYQHYQLILLHLANPLLFKDCIWYTVLAFFLAKLFGEPSPNFWNFAGWFILVTSSPKTEDYAFILRNYIMAHSSGGFMSLTGFAPVLVMPLSFLSDRTISCAFLSSSLFSTTWADLFRPTFCSVVTFLAQARPRESDPACKLKITSCKNVAVPFFFLYTGIYPIDMALMLSSDL